MYSVHEYLPTGAVAARSSSRAEPGRFLRGWGDLYAFDSVRYLGRVDVVQDVVGAFVGRREHATGHRAAVGTTELDVAAGAPPPRNGTAEVASLGRA
jgi:hypothetical protein